MEYLSSSRESCCLPDEEKRCLLSMCTVFRRSRCHSDVCLYSSFSFECLMLGLLSILGEKNSGCLNQAKQVAGQKQYIVGRPLLNRRISSRQALTRFYTEALLSLGSRPPKDTQSNAEDKSNSASRDSSQPLSTSAKTSERQVSSTIG